MSYNVRKFQKYRNFQADPLVIENRQRAPQTLMPGGFIKPADHYDAFVDAKSGKCLPYPCPFAIKIYFSNFEDADLYNGYYVINPPATFLGKVHIMQLDHIRLAKSPFFF